MSVSTHLESEQGNNMFNEFENYIMNRKDDGYIAVSTCPKGHEIVEIEVPSGFAEYYHDWIAVPVGTNVNGLASQWDENRIEEYQSYNSWYWCFDNKRWAFPDYNSMRQGENQIWYDGEVRG